MLVEAPPRDGVPGAAPPEFTPVADTDGARAAHAKAGAMAAAVPSLNGGNQVAAWRSGDDRGDGGGGRGSGGGNADRHASSPSPPNEEDPPRRGQPPSVAAALHVLDGHVRVARAALAEVDRAVAGMRAALVADEGGRGGGRRGEELSAFQ